MECRSFLEISIPDSRDTITVLAVLLSFVPWVAGFGIVVAGFQSTAGSRLRLLMVLTIGLIVVNEALLKRVVSQPRPPESCLKSKGMPSSHSALSVAWAVTLLIYPQRTLRDKICAVTLLSVPWARVQVGDHTPSQVIAGSALGLIAALAAWRMKRDTLVLN